MKVGILHPGAMGSSLLTDAATHSPHSLLWAGDGRSPETHQRAAAAGNATNVGSMANLCTQVELIVSVCPPDAALALASTVQSHGFDGLYCDANAVAPKTAKQIAALFERFVDGSIIGPPVQSPTSTRLYLSGNEAQTVANVWTQGNLDARVIDGGPGAASALKMAYAGWTKASAALLLAIRAMAKAEGVEEALLSEWAISQKDLEARSQYTAAGAGPKGWRFAGEMREIAASMENAGLPGQLHQGAAEIWESLAPLKGSQNPDIAAVLALLLRN